MDEVSVGVSGSAGDEAIAVVSSGVDSVSVNSEAGSAASGISGAYVDSAGPGVEWSVSDVWGVVSGVYVCSVSDGSAVYVVWEWAGDAVAGLVYVLYEVVVGSGV